MNWLKKSLTLFGKYSKTAADATQNGPISHGFTPDRNDWPNPTTQESSTLTLNVVTAFGFAD